MKRWIIAGLGAMALACAGTASARVDIGVNIGVPGPVYGYGGPVYVAPPPVYRPPVYYAPPPIYYPPPRVYYSPRPVYYGPRPHHGPRHWDHPGRGPDRHWKGHRHRHGGGPGRH